MLSGLWTGYDVTDRGVRRGAGWDVAEVGGTRMSEATQAAHACFLSRAAVQGALVHYRLVTGIIYALYVFF